ncbi:hypothetical protein SeMB42_g00416 [Synchytrium endobioticum]|uniref:Uncharacterized protein n=1 Tax=Synchytrium endobioticum TaxID=286115 RepID=A0A507DR46_9FUNG|nr:hypothetical protein SeMB42_g00416 [Synchytrium endobioticum]
MLRTVKVIRMHRAFRRCPASNITQRMHIVTPGDDITQEKFPQRRLRIQFRCHSLLKKCKRISANARHVMNDAQKSRSVQP